jgi:hypothetical protein
VKVNEKDLGYSIGGPIGKPGGNNKLFFFYAHEYAPRTGGGDTQRFRFPTALERAGDFSQTLDNNGNLFPYIKDPSHVEGELRVGYSGHPQQRHGAAGARLDRQRLAAFRGVDGDVGRGLHRGRLLPGRCDRKRQPEHHGVTGRNATMQLTSPTNGTQVNLPYDASGNLLTNRSLPRNAGFGVANGYQAPRTMQAQIRFSF